MTQTLPRRAGPRRRRAGDRGGAAHRDLGGRQRRDRRRQPGHCAAEPAGGRPARGLRRTGFAVAGARPPAAAGPGAPPCAERRTRGGGTAAVMRITADAAALQIVVQLQMSVHRVTFPPSSQSAESGLDMLTLMLCAYGRVSGMSVARTIAHRCASAGCYGCERGAGAAGPEPAAAPRRRSLARPRQ